MLGGSFLAAERSDDRGSGAYAGDDQYQQQQMEDWEADEPVAARAAPAAQDSLNSMSSLTEVCSFDPVAKSTPRAAAAAAAARTAVAAAKTAAPAAATAAAVADAEFDGSDEDEGFEGDGFSGNGFSGFGDDDRSSETPALHALPLPLLDTEYVTTRRRRW
jgi:hypothetical protein